MDEFFGKKESLSQLSKNIVQIDLFWQATLKEGRKDELLRAPQETAMPSSDFFQSLLPFWAQELLCHSYAH